MNNKLISIIIPCYNAERYLRSTLESLLWQTYPNWECILIDDGSTDATADVLKHITRNDSRFHYYFQTNKGPSVARNNGVEKSKGDFIQFLDADDFLLPERFAVCIAEIEKQNVDVIYSDFASYHGNGVFLKTLHGKIPSADVAKEMLFNLNVTFAVLTHSMLFTRSVIEKNPFDDKLPFFAEDQDCWVRIALSGAKFFYVDRILVIYNFIPENLTSNESKLISSKILMLKKYKHDPRCASYGNDFLNAERYLKQRLAIAHFMEKSFSNGFQVFRTIYKISSLKANLKITVWLLLMFFFSKNIIARLREWIVKNTPFKWGGWKNTQQWIPPEELKSLVDNSNV